MSSVAMAPSSLSVNCLRHKESKHTAAARAADSSPVDHGGPPREPFFYVKLDNQYAKIARWPYTGQVDRFSATMPVTLARLEEE